MEHVLYNAQHGFTLQYMLLLAPLGPTTASRSAPEASAWSASILDILLAWRLWNFRSIAYSTMQYAMFIVMRDIRGLAPEALAHKLHECSIRSDETFASNDRLRMHQQNRYALHRILARLTDYVETQSGQPSQVSRLRERRKEPLRGGAHLGRSPRTAHRRVSLTPADFAEYRNRIGGLLLLPKSFNASYGDLTYAEKLPHYNTQNLLARSLHPQCYEHNPGSCALYRPLACRSNRTRISRR